MAHGTFSVLDVFPVQWDWSFPPPTFQPTCNPLYPMVCNSSVSIPLSERLFGQGVIAHVDNFAFTTKTN